MDMEKLNINIDNSKWYRNKVNGSILLYKGVYSIGLIVKTIKPNGLETEFKGYKWGILKTIQFRDNPKWEKLTSPVEVLKAINQGMKCVGYHNDVIVQSYSKSENGSHIFDSDIKLSDYYFDFKNKSHILDLMIRGNLVLINSKGHKAVVAYYGGLSPIKHT